LLFDTPYGYDRATKIFWFFGRSGFLSQSGSWVLNPDPEFVVNPMPVEEVAAEPFSPIVAEIFEGDEANGRADAIAYLRVSPIEAVWLALEGIITEGHIAPTDLLHQGLDERYIDVPKVTLAGRLVTIRVMEDNDTETWTLDSEGDPIP
jgi:hypothetical protein